MAWAGISHIWDYEKMGHSEANKKRAVKETRAPASRKAKLERVSSETGKRSGAEDVPRDKQEVLQTILDNIPVMIAFLDSQGRHKFVNKAWEQTLGWSLQEAQSRDVLKDFYPDDEYRKYVVEFIRTAESKWGDFKTRRRDGVVLDTCWANVPLSDGSNIGIGLDITERIRAEGTLRESEERYRAIFEQAADSIVLFDAKTGVMLNSNRKAYENLGYSREEFQKLKIADIEARESEQGVTEHIEKVIREGEDIFETKHRTKGREIRDILVSAKVISIGGRDLIQGIWRDITERKRAEQKLLDYQTQLKSLASELTLAEERERRRIATDLHATIAQSLVFSKIKLDVLRSSAPSEGLATELNEISDLIYQTIQDVRSLTFDLSFPVLYELGFVVAVSEWLIEQIQKKYDITTEFEDDGQLKPLDDDVCVFLFRNVRELLINVVKHANAKKVKVSIRKVGNEVYVSVEDDGCGFDTKKVAATAVGKGGFGLFSIRERLEELGGHLEIDSKPGRGAKVTLIAPLKQQNTKRGQK